MAGCLKQVKIPQGYYLKGYKVKIYPDDSQKELIDNCINANIFIYNWALEQENIQFGEWKDGKSDKRILSIYDLDAKFTELRKSLDWLQNIPHNSARSGIRRLRNAFERFFQGVCRKPRFKSKKKMTKFTYTTRADRMFFEGNLLRIEGINGGFIYTRWNSGWTKKTTPKIYNPVITKTNLGEYFVSFKIMEPIKYNYFNDNNIEPLHQTIGIDLNVKDRFVLSNGMKFRAPDISKHEKKLKRMHRKHQKDLNRYYKELERANPEEIECIQLSNRAQKRQDKIRKEYAKIHNINENFIQTTTKRIIDLHPDCIVMEHISGINMKRKKHIAKLTHYTNFYRCREVMERKAFTYNIPFILADRYYKSSQICSQCGHVQNIGSRKIYKCPSCGLEINRDLNAAINLEHYPDIISKLVGE